jgi:predicted Rossmann fold nucleotide-binding protein DprA/Smf involved in DNA uptake
LVALYNAVGHTLGAPAIQRPGQVTKLFDAVAAEHPEIAEAKGAVEEVERLRCAWITWGVTDWPVELKKLPGIFLDCLRMVRSWTLM